jgi:hypothetical protein
MRSMLLGGAMCSDTHFNKVSCFSLTRKGLEHRKAPRGQVRSYLYAICVPLVMRA